MRKQPRQARARATFDAILEAAARILETRGLAGFTTNAIAEVAGVSIGTLYQYAPNKNAILVALIAREANARAQALENLARHLAGRPIATIAESLIDAALANETRRPALARALDHAEARLAPDPLLEAAAHRIDEALAPLLAPHVPYPARAARTLRLAIRALLDDALNATHPTPEAARTEALALTLGYLARTQITASAPA